MVPTKFEQDQLGSFGNLGSKKEMQATIGLQLEKGIGEKNRGWAEIEGYVLSTCFWQVQLLHYCVPDENMYKRTSIKKNLM